MYKILSVVIKDWEEGTRFVYANTSSTNKQFTFEPAKQEEEQV